MLSMLLVLLTMKRKPCPCGQSVDDTNSEEKTMKWLQDCLLFELHSCSSGKSETVHKLDTYSTNTDNNHLLVQTRTVGSKSKINKKTAQQDLHSLLIYRLLLALHKHQAVRLSVYGFIFVVCTWQLFLSVAIAKTKPELFVRILVYSALPIAM
ncbi:uncharacterized protein LOC134191482 isoform X2 [Corticium candelabrum]|uniref:uncharacterized protein LOC134191482 isoform X2 n=1 Tax=Corticium candelabrum TaxID=121492 RepID=UPI002E25A52D|nr:uncharacterized protein LOC134191482 isoform X2 [Corticium candelabrum]